MFFFKFFFFTVPGCCIPRRVPALVSVGSSAGIDPAAADHLFRMSHRHVHLHGTFRMGGRYHRLVLDILHLQYAALVKLISW